MTKQINVVSEFHYSLDGKFYTPRVVLNEKGKNVEVKAGLCLSLAYVAHAMIERSPVKYKNMTKAKAGALTYVALQTIDKSDPKATLKFYLPADKNGTDYNVLIATVTVKDMLATANVLKLVYDVLYPAIAQVDKLSAEVAASSPVITTVHMLYDDVIPEVTTGAGKKAGAVVAVESLY